MKHKSDYNSKDDFLRYSTLESWLDYIKSMNNNKSFYNNSSFEKLNSHEGRQVINLENKMTSQEPDENSIFYIP